MAKTSAGSSRAQGAQSETIALEYLQQQGLRLHQRNFYSRFGEIDLIMRSSQEWVFVEVRQRKAGFAAAAFSISPAKQRKLRKTAEYFLLCLGYEVNCRFDVVLLDANLTPCWLQNVII